MAGSAGQRWRIIDTYEMVPLAYNTAKTCFQSKFANCDLTQIYQDNKLAIDTHHKTKYHKAAKDFEMEIMDLQKNLPFIKQLDLCWELLKKHFKPEETFLPKYLITEYWT